MHPYEPSPKIKVKYNINKRFCFSCFSQFLMHHLLLLLSLLCTQQQQLLVK
jgi:hypothetical protein